jgi:hypothetical protein
LQRALVGAGLAERGAPFSFGFLIAEGVVPPAPTTAASSRRTWACSDRKYHI